METSYTSDQTLTVLDRVGSPWVGDYFDTGGAAGRGWDPVREVRQRGSRIVQLHVKGPRGAALDTGAVDLEALGQALRDVGYDGWLMLETSAGDDPIGSARRNLAVLRRYFG
jgi:sugar phosphate isomerase/epimerase